MTLYDIALTMVPNLGPTGIVHLIERFGSAEAVFAASREDLIRGAELRAAVAEDILGRRSCRMAEEELRYLGKHRLTAVASTDGDYPALLRDCPDRPHVLYVRGNSSVLRSRMLSMVGTRSVTPYGQRMCDRLVAGMAERMPGTVIVSGLAFGVDICCHRASLAYALPTVAVVANALPDVTPAQHRRIADEIVDAGGAIVSELHSRTKQNGKLYLARNRVIAGLGAGTVIVESPLEGGSMTTAEYADGYCRTVMAVPGRAGERSCAGTNRLIKTKKALLVEHAGDIVYELGWDIEKAGFVPERKSEPLRLEGDARRVMEVIACGEALDMDTLSTRSGVPTAEISSVLLGLEMDGLLRRIRGNRYEKV